MARKTTDAREILRKRFYRDPARRRALEEARSSAEIAQLIHDLRKQAGLTQKELAERIGSTSSVVSRLEASDYNGHSLSMLRRVAEALGRRVVIRLEDAPDASQPV